MITILQEGKTACDVCKEINTQYISKAEPITNKQVRREYFNGRMDDTLLIDTETLEIVTLADVYKEFLYFKKQDPDEYNYSFSEYIGNCTSKNGFLKWYIKGF